MKKKIKNKSNAKTLSSTSLRHGLFRRPHYDMVSFVDLTIKWPLRSLKVILKKKRGFYDYRSDDYVSIVQWKDNKVVYIASNFVNITSIKVVKRYSQRERKKLIALNLFGFTNITWEWEMLTFWTDLLVSTARSFMAKNDTGLFF